jgi:small subunit ribosomal protein S4
MRRILEKKERALGSRLFLKGERCASPKCASVRKPYRPGQHGKRFKKVSGYGKQLAEKQKVRFTYGLNEAELAKYFRLADRSSEPTAVSLTKLLESRLDNVVFQAGFASSRRIARQLVSHGHIQVNGRKVTIPSFSIRVGDRINFRPESADHPIARELANRWKNYEAPVWLVLDKEKLAAEVLSLPQDVQMPFDLNLVVNYYSK